MNKVLGEYYPLIVIMLWVVSLPMIAGDYGFVPRVLAAVVAAGIAMLLVKATRSKSRKVKAISLFISIITIGTLMALFVKRENATANSQQIEATE